MMMSTLMSQHHGERPIVPRRISNSLPADLRIESHLGTLKTPSKRGLYLTPPISAILCIYDVYRKEACVQHEVVGLISHRDPVRWKFSFVPRQVVLHRTIKHCWACFSE
jgi:hypothetical protein